MTEADSPAFAVALTALAEVYGEELSKTRIRLYFEALRHVDFARIQAAFQQAMRTCRFFPKPAELLDLIDGDLEDRAAYQWSQVMLAIRRRENELDATAREAIALMGGWREVDWLTYRHVTAVDVATARKHFLQMYRVAAKRLEDRYLPALPGASTSRELPDGSR